MNKSRQQDNGKPSIQLRPEREIQNRPVQLYKPEQIFCSGIKRQKKSAQRLLQLEVTKFKAGSLKNFVDKWKHITEDDWILETISVYKIEFEQEPVQNCIPNTPNFNNTECALIDDEVEKMLSMGAIEKSQHEDNEFISNIFPVQKKNGKFRPVINLKKLNKFVEYHHFKMETLQHVAELLKRYAYFTSVD